MTQSCMLRPQGDATRNPEASGRNSPATAQSDRLPASAMTGSELRAQLRMQLRRNSAVAGDATKQGPNATSCNCPTDNAWVANDAVSACWQVRYPSAGPMEVQFTPPASRAEVAKVYPGAEIDVLPEPSRRMATPSEGAELRELVALVLADAGDADRKEALALALGDPEAALTSFRLLADQARDSALWAPK